MGTKFAIANAIIGKLNALVKKVSHLMGYHLVNVHFFQVTSDGTTGPGWLQRLEKTAERIYFRTRTALLSDSFRPTKGVTYTIAVLQWTTVHKEPHSLRYVLAEGDRRGLKHGKDINPEVACLIREKFTGEELQAMGLERIEVMHEPIAISDAFPGPCIFCVDCVEPSLVFDEVKREIDLSPHHRLVFSEVKREIDLSPRVGYAFVVPQVA